MILQWLVVELGLYPEMSLGEALLGIIIILACIIIFGQPRRVLTARELEDQAKRMELASRRLEHAQRRLRSTKLRASRSSRPQRSPDRRRATRR